ncbi:MAG: glutamine--tRNA ligase, partial [Verrucomicrobia bacterium]|nr:glutamine--tRNA ligase [Verrucomicrobiota bacterium]
GTIHWVSAAHCVDAQIRNYDRLFTEENPLADKEADFKTLINPDALQVTTAKLEASLGKTQPGNHYQFERVGYFCADLDHTESAPIFNRTLTLRAPRK